MEKQEEDERELSCRLSSGAVAVREQAVLAESAQGNPPDNACSVSRRAALQAMALVAFGTIFALSSPDAAYAKARKYYRIIYKLHGGKNPDKQVRYIRRGRSKAVSKLAIPKRTGYKFVGWYTNAARTKPAKRVKGRKQVSKRTIHAKWKIKTYKISYYMGGGSSTLSLTSSYTIKSATITPFPPNRDGYRFSGWYSDASFSKKRSSIKKGSAGNVKLYAKWKPTTYWDEHLNSKINTVNTLSASIANPIPSFVFITDIHLPSNALVSFDLVKRVAKNTDLGMVVFGGDCINHCSQKPVALETLRFVRHAFGDTEFHFVHGNHDSNTQKTGVLKSQIVSDAEFLAIARSDREVREGNNLYYYRDDEVNKLRYIFMDSNHPDANYLGSIQLDWLRETILELDETWTVLVFIHQFFNPSKLVDGQSYCSFDANGKLVQTLLDSIYDESRARIAGVISGHCHCDWSAYSEKGYPMVATTCDAYGKIRAGELGRRKIGNTTEQAFDIVTIDKDEQTLFFTRVGFGEDRQFTYKPPEIEPEPQDPIEDPGSDELQAGQPA